MKLTEQEFNTLARFEDKFSVALHSHYARGIGRTEAETLHPILCRVTGIQYRLNPSCSRCIYNLLCDLGKFYFADKAEREAAKAPEVQPATEPVKAPKTAANKPKTAKKTTTKKTSRKVKE